MKRFTTAVCALFVMICAAAQGYSKYSPRFNDFNDLTVASDINVVYKCNPDSAGFAVFECHPSVAHAITFSFNKKKLKIEVSTDSTLTHDLPTVTVYSSQLVKATNLGKCSLRLVDLEPVEELSLKVIGNGTLAADGVKCTRLNAASQAGKGTVTVAGVVNEASYTIAGVGAVCAFSTSAIKAKCWVTGTGNIECNARDALTVYGAGSGTVIYSGNPQIKKRALGVKLEHIDADE